MSCYIKAANELFQFLKHTKDIKSSWINSITAPDGSFLVPVTHATLNSVEDIESISFSRNYNASILGRDQSSSHTNTTSWIEKSILNVDNVIIFSVKDNGSNYKGLIGLRSYTNQGENFLLVENLSKEANHETISTAIQTMISWIMPILPIDTITALSFKDDVHEIALWKKNAFKHDIGPKFDIHPANSLDPLLAEAQVTHYYHSQEQPATDQMILTAGPSISPMEGYFAYDAAMNGWNSEWSKYISMFEKEFATYVGAKHAIATSSCTGALQIALLSLNISEGDEVIVPDETWVASATAVRDVGATPIFCDVDIETYNINPEDCEAKITNKTRAIIPVHMYGNPANITEIKSLAEKFSLHVVEDAAPAIGAKVNGQCVGTFGDFGCFSFQGAKMLVTGEGGMLVTNNSELYKKAKKVSDQGRNPNKTFWIDALGVKYKMSNVQAAIGLAQIRRSDLQIYMKKRINSWYRDCLSDLQCIEFQSEYPNSTSVNWMTSIRLLESAACTRDELIERLRNVNVDSRPLFPAISQYPIWNKTQQSGKSALTLGQTAMNLPSGVGLSRNQVKMVADKIRLILTS